jgi:hypothetical protein
MSHGFDLIVPAASSVCFLWAAIGITYGLIALAVVTTRWAIHQLPHQRHAFHICTFFLVLVLYPTAALASKGAGMQRPPDRCIAALVLAGQLSHCLACGVAPRAEEVGRL